MSLLKVKKKGQNDSEARTMTRASFDAGASKRGWVIVSEVVNEKPKSQIQELMEQKKAEKEAKESGQATLNPPATQAKSPGRPKKNATVTTETPVTNEA